MCNEQDVGGGRPHGFPEESHDYRITIRRWASSLAGPIFWLFYIIQRQQIKSHTQAQLIN